MLSNSAAWNRRVVLNWNTLPKLQTWHGHQSKRKKNISQYTEDRNSCFLNKNCAFPLKEILTLRSAHHNRQQFAVQPPHRGALHFVLTLHPTNAQSRSTSQPSLLLLFPFSSLAQNSIRTCFLGAHHVGSSTSRLLNALCTTRRQTLQTESFLHAAFSIKIYARCFQTPSILTR